MQDIIPKVSIVIPFYSHKDWLIESLESVFSQTYHDYEVILVNDGSKEDLSDLLETYKDKIIYLEQENKGPGAARNLGMKYARGKYIAFEDADDLWLPNKLEIQIPFMEERNLIWSHTGFFNWWPETGHLQKVNVGKDYGDIYIQRLISVRTATPCIVIERKYLVDNCLMFPEDIRNGEDGAFYTSISQCCPIGLVLQPLAKVRIRGKNSNTHAIERFRLNATTYLRLKEKKGDIPNMVVNIKHIYYFFSKLFPGRITPIKEFFAKCLWFFPYVFERIYIRYLARTINKEEKYILR